MVSIFSLHIVLKLSILATRIATVALTYTGLSRQAVRFQARSAFTGVGFSTKESETVVNHPARRKILMLLMMLGNAGVITAASSLILSFVNVEEEKAKHPVLADRLADYRNYRVVEPRKQQLG